MTSRFESRLETLSSILESNSTIDLSSESTLETVVATLSRSSRRANGLAIFSSNDPVSEVEFLDLSSSPPLFP